GIYLEITARKQHSPPNKHVAEMARRTGAKLIVDSDAHDELDLLTSESARSIAESASLTEAEIIEALQTNPQALLRKLLPK
ncbi:MAG TPA: PHP domain-containing protein, partial [Dehalococcoidia bacterium]|nr:PHP domain-containing protein [Dehalococcoidia bacterium]